MLEGVYAGSDFTREKKEKRISEFNILNPKTLEEAKNSIKILTREKAELRKEIDALKEEIEKALTIAKRLHKTIVGGKR